MSAQPFWRLCDLRVQNKPAEPKRHGDYAPIRSSFDGIDQLMCTINNYSGVCYARSMRNIDTNNLDWEWIGSIAFILSMCGGAGIGWLFGKLTIGAFAGFIVGLGFLAYFNLRS